MALPPTRLLVVLAFVSFASNWQFGYQITYINTASPAFVHLAQFARCQSVNGVQTTDCTIHPDTTSWSSEWSLIVSSFYVGTFFGFVSVPYLYRSIGVQNALLFSCFPALFGCFLQLLGRVAASIGELAFVGDLVVGRFLVGIQAGCALCLLPIFTIETSPPRFRAFLSSLQQVAQAASTLIGLLVGSETIIPLGSSHFEFTQVIGLLPTLAFAIVLYRLPKTPFHIVDTNGFDSDESELEESVEFYHGNRRATADVKIEAYERWDVGYESAWEELMVPENLKGLIIGTLAGISYAFTADDIIDSYSSELLEADGFGETASEAVTVIYGALLVLASIFGSFMVDRFGSKRVLVIGLCCTALFNGIAFIGAVTDVVIFEMVGFGLTKLAIGLGAGGPAWFLTSEIVNPRVTPQAQAVSTGSLLVTSGLVTFFFLPANASIGPASLLFFAVIPALILAAAIAVLLPDPLNRTYNDIREALLRKTFSGLISPNDCTGPSMHWSHAGDLEPLNKLSNDSSFGYGSLQGSVDVF